MIRLLLLLAPLLAQAKVENPSLFIGEKTYGVTVGSILFGNGNNLAQDNANLYWDDSNNRLGIGTNTPATSLQILGNVSGNLQANITNSNATNANSVAWTATNDSGNVAALTMFGTTFIATYLNNAARLSGTKALWLSSDVNGTSGGTDNIVLSPGGYNNIIAQATPTLFTAVNYQDTGIAASNAGAPVSINASQVLVPGVGNYEAAATANVTTTSTTDVLMTGMTVTPAAGTYMVTFSTWCTQSNGAAGIYISLYNGATQQAGTLRTIVPFPNVLGGATLYMVASTNAIMTATGSSTIQVRWRVNSGTGSCNDRTLDLVRIQ